MEWMPARIVRPLMMWLAHKLPACDEVTRLASEKLDRKLTLRERLDLKLHLMICRLCSRYYDQIRLLHQLAPQLSDRLYDETISSNGRLSAEARERIVRLIATASRA